MKYHFYFTVTFDLTGTTFLLTSARLLRTSFYFYYMHYYFFHTVHLWEASTWTIMIFAFCMPISINILRQAFKQCGVHVQKSTALRAKCSLVNSAWRDSVARQSLRVTQLSNRWSPVNRRRWIIQPSYHMIYIHVYCDTPSVMTSIGTLLHYGHSISTLLSKYVLGRCFVDIC